METIELDVKGMSCDGCENSVKVAVGDLAGVDAVEADHASGRVRVTAATPVDLDAIKNAITEAGFTVV
jgi:copper chaperone CopZ